MCYEPYSRGGSIVSQEDESCQTNIKGLPCQDLINLNAEEDNRICKEFHKTAYNTKDGRRRTIFTIENLKPSATCEKGKSCQTRYGELGNAASQYGVTNTCPSQYGMVNKCPSMAQGVKALQNSCPMKGKFNSVPPVCQNCPSCPTSPPPQNCPSCPASPPCQNCPTIIPYPIFPAYPPAPQPCCQKSQSTSHPCINRQVCPQCPPCPVAPPCPTCPVAPPCPPCPTCPASQPPAPIFLPWQPAPNPQVVYRNTEFYPPSLPQDTQPRYDNSGDAYNERTRDDKRRTRNHRKYTQDSYQGDKCDDSEKAFYKLKYEELEKYNERRKFEEFLEERYKRRRCEDRLESCNRRRFEDCQESRNQQRNDDSIANNQPVYAPPNQLSQFRQIFPPERPYHDEPMFRFPNNTNSPIFVNAPQPTNSPIYINTTPPAQDVVLPTGQLQETNPYLPKVVQADLFKDAQAQFNKSVTPNQTLTQYTNRTNTDDSRYKTMTPQTDNTINQTYTNRHDDNLRKTKSFDSVYKGSESSTALYTSDDSENTDKAFYRRKNMNEYSKNPIYEKRFQ